MIRTLLLTAAIGLAIAPVATGQTVLILGGTVSGGAASLEATKAMDAGMSVEVVDDAGWLAKTEADFSTYRALILGDATCISINASVLAAESNAATWAAAASGNIIIMGSDPEFHASQGGEAYTESGIDFALADADNTGAYITLSCYYHGVAPNTPVPLLDGFAPGGFTVKGVGCFNDAHIVASHPAMDPLTDVLLSNWGCSVHEAFDMWPDVGLSPFLVLAIAENAGGEFTAADGSVGTPYILARGEDLSVISDITLTPEESLGLALGSECCLTATVTEDDVPLMGETVHFEIIAGPQSPQSADIVTDVNGEAVFCYSGFVEGVDTIVASFEDSGGTTQSSNQAVCEFIAECHLVIGSDSGSSGAWQPDYHVFHPQVGQVQESHPVLMDDIPAFPLPSGVSAVATVSAIGVAPHWVPITTSGVPLPDWMADDMLFSVEVVMWNPVALPATPELDSPTLVVAVTPNGRVRTSLTGSGAIDIWAETYTDADGQRWIRFPFQVPGF